VLELEEEAMAEIHNIQTAAPKDVVSNVLTLLNTLSIQHNLDPLKQLFWSELNYERTNQPLSRRGWPEKTNATLFEDPLLLATGGNDDGFHIIYLRLASDELSLADERSIVTQLLKDHLDSLFIFSNRSQVKWHFLNIKSDDKNNSRLLFRRITVGPEEQLRTASERLAMINLADIDPALSNIPVLKILARHEQAFDVEAVTKKFFEQYHVVFERVEQLIQGFTEPELKRLFTQRLFNRLMFIAFIQKKGWLRLNGQTDYMAYLWKAYKQSGPSVTNFYSERLELLFFSGLNTDNDVNIIEINRKGFLKTLIGDVPYLNGGLFEKDKDDGNPLLLVPDECIDAILNDLFARFNFTVMESTPLDIEVAVDPEMLGKVFEELVTGRHETGSYYTPKPVVSFMCREALKGYLQAKLPGETPVVIEQFVDGHNPQELMNPESALDVLRRVKVCDPACGSGAYLLGMLHELLDLRACLFATKHLDPISMYQRKLEIIQNNIYGVDIDPFAVNIARLRLWLSLEVDFEGSKPQPLPNLDFKIEAGDSLLGPDPQSSDNPNARDYLVQEFREKKAAYISTHNYGEKQTLRKEINDLRQGIFTWTHVEGDVATGFDWGVEFAEVFVDGGFDIVVANPPYVRQELIKDLKPSLQKTFPTVYTGTADLYCYFYARALQILQIGGMLTFISSNKWFRANYGSKLRNYISQTCRICSITDFGELPVFQTAATFPMIFVAQKSDKPADSTIFTQVKSLDAPYPDVLSIIQENGHKLPLGAINGSDWTLTDAVSADRLRKMEKAGVPLGEYVTKKIFYGIKTGFNAAFVIDGAKRTELISQDPNSAQIIKPLIIGDDIRKWHVKQKDRWLIVTPIGINIEHYPAVLTHLKKWQAELEKRWDKGNHWWELRPCDYYDSFGKPKLIYPDIAKEPRFAFDANGSYVVNTAYIIPANDLFLLGVLNSESVWEYVKATFACLGDPDRGGRFRLIYQSAINISIPIASAMERAVIAKLVQRCLDVKGVGCEEWEREIDERVAALYGL
jgi:type I restriction-modification system DNA methylase subunit